MRKSKKELTNYSEAYSFALDKLTIRDYSQKELEGKLQERSCPSAVIKEVMTKLLDCKFINEEKYAESVYRGWVSKKYYGRLHLKQYLMKKKVREDYQQSILKNFTPAEETERAEAFLKLQLPKLKIKYKTQEEKLRGAVARALASRGFGSDIVWSCIDKIGED